MIDLLVRPRNRRHRQVVPHFPQIMTSILLLIFLCLTRASASDFPLHSIEVDDRDFFIFDIAGFSEGRNVILDHSDGTGTWDGEPLAYRFNAPCPLRLFFQPDPDCTACQVVLEVHRRDELISSSASVLSLSGIMPISHRISFSTPNRLGIYTLTVGLTLSGPPGTHAEPRLFRSEHRLFILFAAPGFTADLHEWGLRHEDFTKRNLGLLGSWLEQDRNLHPDLNSIVSGLHRRFTDSRFCPYTIFDTPTEFQSPWELVLDAEHCRPMECEPAAALMTQAIHMLGWSKACVRYLGAMADLKGFCHEHLRDGDFEIRIHPRTCNSPGITDSSFWVYDAVCQVEFPGSRTVCHVVSLKAGNGQSPLSGSYESLNTPGPGGFISRYVWYGIRDLKVYTTHPDPKHPASGQDPFAYWRSLLPAD
ncbi:MAG: hypothetical protein PHQ23_09250 [Candidatus Wallbacteria bacterium]|nr:hypothetical protein [Candidatus Wallbacteria bacterium]